MNPITITYITLVAACVYVATRDKPKVKKPCNNVSNAHYYSLPKTNYK